MSVNIARIQLKLISETMIFYNIDRIISPVCDAIKQSHKNIGNASETGNEDYISVIIDEECEVIESLIGAALVVCQTCITKIVSRVIKANQYYNNNRQELKLELVGKEKINIVSKYSPKAGKKYTEIQVIDSLANYFKHNSEWDIRWEKLKKNAKLTKEVISSVGARPGSSGNLRTGVKALGITDYALLGILVDKIRNWRDRIEKEIETKFKKSGLI